MTAGGGDGRDREREGERGREGKRRGTMENAPAIFLMVPNLFHLYVVRFRENELDSENRTI